MDRLIDKPLAFSDWIDSIRDTYPEAAWQLDIAESYSLELLSIRAKMQELEQKRDASIASVDWSLEENQQLIESLIRMVEEDSQDKELAQLCFKAATVNDIVIKAKSIIQTDERLGFKGVTSYEDLELMATGNDSFAIWINVHEHEIHELFVYQDGVVISNEMYSQDIDKLEQCHSEAIAWESFFPAWKARQDAAIEAQRQEYQHFHTTGQLDLAAIASGGIGYRKDRQFVLAVIEQIRDSSEPFCKQFPEAEDYFSALFALTVLQCRYPERQKSEIEHLQNSFEDLLFRLFIEDESLLRMSEGIISESFREQLDKYRNLNQVP